MSRTSPCLALAWSAVKASAVMLMSGSRSSWLGLLWWRLCLATHQSKLIPTSRLAWTRPTRSLARRERKSCRWPASWPTKASWVDTTARYAATSSCHHDSPSMAKATSPAASSNRLTPILAAYQPRRRSSRPACFTCLESWVYWLQRPAATAMSGSPGTGRGGLPPRGRPRRRPPWSRWRRDGRGRPWQAPSDVEAAQVGGLLELLGEVVEQAGGGDRRLGRQPFDQAVHHHVGEPFDLRVDGRDWLVGQHPGRAPETGHARISSPPLRRVHSDTRVRTSTPAESIRIMPRRSSTMWWWP